MYSNISSTNSESFTSFLISVQFSSIAQSCLTLWDTRNCSKLGFPSHHQLSSSLKLMSIKSVMPSNHLIFCRPLVTKSRRGVVVKHRLESERRGLKLNIQKTTESNKSLSMLLNQWLLFSICSLHCWFNFISPNN